MDEPGIVAALRNRFLFGAYPWGTVLGVFVTELSELPPVERAIRYRELARDALREAEQTLGQDRESYLNLAKGWEGLAEVTERILAARVSEASEKVIDVSEEKIAALAPQPKSTDSSEQ